MAERRHAGRRQQRQRLLGRGRQRHGKGLGRPGELQQRLDRELGIELRRGADHEDHRIVAVVGQQPLDGARHDLGLGAGQREIDQLALARAMPSGFSQSTSACGGSTMSRPAIAMLSTTMAAPPPVVVATATRLPLPLIGWRRAIDQQRRHIDQRFEHRHPRDAVAAAEGVEGGVGAGDGAGMRFGQLLADLGAAELVGDHRLARRMGAPRRVRQALAIAQRLHEQQDRVGPGIVDQQVGDLAHREIDLVADRDQPREADAARIGARQQGADQAAALAHHRPFAGPQPVDGEGGIGGERHRRIGADRADAVGPDQPDAGLAHDARQVVLQRGAGGAGIGEAAGQDRGHLHAAPAARRQRLDRILAVQQDVGVVDVTRDRIEVLVGLVAENFGARRIDRQDLALEAVLAQEALRPRCRLGFVGGGADQGDAARFEQGGEQRVGMAHAASILGA